MKLIRARAPVRFDFGGGWTDVALFSKHTKGKVVNAALNIYCYATLMQFDAPDPLHGKIVMESADFGTFFEASDIKKIEYDGNIDLVKAAVRRYSSGKGFKIVTQSNAPPGSGLGTSAAMGVALVGMIAAHNDKPMLPYEIAEAASSIEREELGILGGKQDQYASAIGGIGFMEFRGEEVQTSALRLEERIILELERNLVLCYSGKSRLSGDIHRKVTDAFLKGERDTVEAIEKLKDIAEDMKGALLRGDLGGFAELLEANWQCQKRLHPSVTNEHLEALFDLAYRSGAIGGKAGGAGGGGCLIFYCEPGKEHVVSQQLKEAGGTVLPFNFDFDGLKIWRGA